MDISKKKCMTAKDVQDEYLNMDIRKIRTFLNQYCTFRKIGKTYFYLRTEVEALLLDTQKDHEFPLDTY